MKKKFYLFVQSQLSLGKNPSKISKEFNISKQKLNYYIRKLKNEGTINKKGYGTWEVKTSPKHPMINVPKLIRGHAFIWTIQLPKEIKGWNERKEILEKNNIQFKQAGNTLRIFINNKKVWLNNKTLTIYEPHSFYGVNSIESRKYAVISLINCLKSLESKFGINLKPYTFKPAREHYGLIKNDLAIQCNERGEKIHIRDNQGEWLWIDNSESLGELETGGTKALVNSVGVQNWWNDMKKSNFKVTPSFLMESIGGLIQTQQMNADNIIKHQKVLDEMSETLKLIRKNLNG